MQKNHHRITCLGFFVRGTLLTALLTSMPWAHADVTLLNASYDVTREFYKDYNPVFIKHWKDKTGESITVNQSHGGSSKQANSVAEGLQADVITMNQATDIDILYKKAQLIPKDWAKRLPDNSSPTTSVTVLLVRQGNPKKIKDWVDLARPGVSVIIPNPKTSGNGRYTYLAAYGAVLSRGGDESNAKALVRGIFANVPVLDGGGRAATTTFAQRGIGDVLATFESEVPLIKAEFGDKYEVIYPSLTVLAENPVSVVDKVVDAKGTRRQAEAYLKFLWSTEGQTVAAKRHLRPRSAKVLAQFADAFPPVKTFTVAKVFGSWDKAQQTHFNDGGVYDQILLAGRR